MQMQRRVNFATRTVALAGFAVLFVLTHSDARAQIASPGLATARVGTAFGGAANSCQAAGACTAFIDGTFPVVEAGQQLGTITARSLASAFLNGLNGPEISLDIRASSSGFSQGTSVATGATGSWGDGITLYQLQQNGSPVPDLRLFNPQPGTYTLEWEVGFNAPIPANMQDNILSIFALIGNNRFNAQFEPGVDNCLGCQNGVLLNATFGAGEPAGAELTFGMGQDNLAELLHNLLFFGIPVQTGGTPYFFDVLENFVPPPAGFGFPIGLEVTETATLPVQGGFRSVSFGDPMNFTLFDPSGNIVPNLVFVSQAGATYSVTGGPSVSVPVPEPPTWTVLLMGFAAIGRIRLRRHGGRA